MIRPLLLLAIGITACQADETISGYTDPNTVWELYDMNGIAPKSKITIAFPEQGKVAGRGPCNRYFGSQTRPLPWFTVQQIGSTKMACENLGEEREYFKVLKQATLAEVSETVLILSDDTGPVLTYKRRRQN